MSLRLTRQDGSQELNSLSISLPEGLTAKLAGVPYCSESAIGAAMARSEEGLGALELVSPSCPAASQVGQVSVGAGSGLLPLYVNTGKAYLTGPYRGAPLGLVVVTPAIAGPFDLGTVVVRTALRVDPSTTKITAVSDPIPSTLFGIPLDVRDLRININRQDFALNPTSCEEMRFAGTATAVSGATAPVDDRFQVGSCERLAFAPNLKLVLKGSKKRAGFPALKAILTMKSGEANIAKSTVTLPHSEFVEQSHIGTICTRVKFAANECPAKSVYGHARAFSPLLDQLLEGPVYLRANGGERGLPDLVAALKGQIEVDVVGYLDSVNARLRARFQTVPDAPISKFVLSMDGGKKSLIVNSTNVCKGDNRASVKMVGQNGKVSETKTSLSSGCKK